MEIKIIDSIAAIPSDIINILIPVLKTESLDGILAEIAAFGVVGDLKGNFSADYKEVQLFHTSEGKQIWLLGLGEGKNSGELIAAFRFFGFSQKKKLKSRISLVIMSPIDLSPNHQPSTTNDINIMECAITGMLLGTYKVGVYKSEQNGVHPFNSEDAGVYFVTKLAGALPKLEMARSIGETQKRVMDLVNAAPNKKTPDFLADWAQKSGEEYGYKVDVFNRKKCEALGLNAFLSVNDGSAQEPAFIVMEYTPKGGAAGLKKIGLVGKGISFDTGGISIKPSSNMSLMKSDMGGAAAVFGTMELAAKLQLNIHLIGIVPSTENMVDGKATKPGSVVGSFLGKTIEVIDTDAEGRIVLADGLGYMVKKFKPEVLIDLATLTGSVVATFGPHCAGLFSNNDELSADLIKAADQTGERLWRLPIWDAYSDDLKSDVADVANYHNKPTNGAIVAAKFLEVFTDKHPTWAHLDIAGTALASNELGSQRVATAFGVRLLIEYLRSC
jgi:leucyl aminopeptidase